MAEPKFQKYKDQGFMAYFVVAETNQGTPPTQAYCKQIRSTYKLTMPVLYDPTYKLKTAYGYGAVNHRNFVVGQGNKLVFGPVYNQDAKVNPAIEAELAK